MLLRERADVVMLIVGAGKQKKGLEALVRSKGLQRSIRFIGQIPFDQVQRYYSIFDVCPFPRSSHQVTRLVPPLKILEAMAMEKPVIVSELEPLLEMVNPGITGLAAKPNDAESLCDALRAMYEDEARRRSLAKAGREWVCRERSWEKVSERFLPLYSPSANA